jgi:hypothetical protein
VSKPPRWWRSYVAITVLSSVTVLAYVCGLHRCGCPCDEAERYKGIWKTGAEFHALFAAPRGGKNHWHSSSGRLCGRQSQTFYLRRESNHNSLVAHRTFRGHYADAFVAVVFAFVYCMCVRGVLFRLSLARW